MKKKAELKFTPTFGFEFGVVRLQNELFRPLDDAETRWFDYSSEIQEWLGTRFRILYRLNDGRYVFLIYSCCLGRQEEHDGRKLEIWRSQFPPEGGVISQEQAVVFLLGGEQEIPADLQEAVRQVLNPPAPPVRSLSHWAGRRLLERRTGHQAHETDVLAQADKIVLAAIRMIQNLRSMPSSHRASALDGARELGIVLFLQYEVAPDGWWNSTTIAPASVNILQLRWPEGSLAVRELIRGLQEDLEAPLYVTDRLAPVAASDRPTEEEWESAVTFLTEMLPDLEQRVLRLRDALAALRQAKCEVSEDAVPDEPLKCPSDEEIRMYLLSQVYGGTQDDVAKRYTDVTGIEKNQSQVSKSLSKVRKWIEAGNIMPPISPPLPKSAKAIDPAKLDLGGPKEHRPPDQREKAGEQ